METGPGVASGPSFSYEAGARTHHSKRWMTKRTSVAARGKKRPSRKLPLACDITPTIHGIAAGPTAARENMTAPMLRALTPYRRVRRDTVMGYKVAKLNPVSRAAAITIDS